MENFQYNNFEHVAESHLNQLLELPYGTGHITGLEYSMGTGDRDLEFTSGQAYVDGAVVDVPASDPVTIDAGQSQPRKDVVFADSAGELQVAKGEPAAALPEGNTGRDTYSPTPPDLSAMSAVPLVEVWVDEDAQAIASDDVFDRRLSSDIDINRAHFDEAEIDQATVTNGPKTWSPDDGTLLEGLQSVPVGNNGEFSDIFLGELIAVPSPNGTFGAVDFQDINGDTDDTPSGVTITGTGGQSNTPIVGSGSHTLKLSTNDAYVEDLSVRQQDSTGSYDAIHISEREARVEDVGIDNAPRYGIYAGHVEAFISEVEVSAGDTAAVFVDSRRNIINAAQIKTPPSDGLVLNDGNNVVSGSFVVGAGGDAIVIDSFGNVVEAVVRDNDGVGIRLNGAQNRIDCWVGLSGGESLVISGDDNVISGYLGGDVLLESGAENNDLTTATISGTVNDNSGNSTNDY